jgi:peroxiredoxin
MIKKNLPIKSLWLIVILVSALGVGWHLIPGGFFEAAGSPEKSLERLFGDMGLLKMPHATQPVEIQLEDIFGNSVSLSQFRGKIVFLNFWATWCPTCVVEMPSMEKLHRRLQDRDFVMVAVNLQEGEAQVKTFFEKFELSFAALLDTSGEVASGLAVRALPTTFVLGKDGRILAMALGAREWDNPSSFELFEFLAGRDTAPVATQSS